MTIFIFFIIGLVVQHLPFVGNFARNLLAAGNLRREDVGDDVACVEKRRGLGGMRCTVQSKPASEAHKSPPNKYVNFRAKLPPYSRSIIPQKLGIEEDHVGAGDERPLALGPFIREC